MKAIGDKAETELSATYARFNDLHTEARSDHTTPERYAEILDHMEAIAKSAGARWGRRR